MYNEFVFGIVGSIFFLIGGIMAVLSPRLSRILCPIFDPDLKDELVFLYWIPGLPRTWRRAAKYAMAVTFGREYYSLLGPRFAQMDFQGRLAPKELRFCRICAYLIALQLIVIMPMMFWCLVFEEDPKKPWGANLYAYVVVPLTYVGVAKYWWARKNRPKP